MVCFLKKFLIKLNKLIFCGNCYNTKNKFKQINNSEPVEGSAYIVGEPNSTVVAHLLQPATLRCAAGGYPKPFVTWWRGDKMLPLKDDRYEVTRDYSLMFSRVELYDLGPYTCQAYNAIDRPVSITITLKARGSAQPRTDEDRRYIQYIVTEPAPPTRPVYTIPPPTQTPTQPPRRPQKPIPSRPQLSPSPPSSSDDTYNGKFFLCW